MDNCSHRRKEIAVAESTLDNVFGLEHSSKTFPILISFYEWFCYLEQIILWLNLHYMNPSTSTCISRILIINEYCVFTDVLCCKCGKLFLYLWTVVEVRLKYLWDILNVEMNWISHESLVWFDRLFHKILLWFAHAWLSYHWFLLIFYVITFLILLYVPILFLWAGWSANSKYCSL